MTDDRILDADEVAAIRPIKAPGYVAQWKGREFGISDLCDSHEALRAALDTAERERDDWKSQALHYYGLAARVAALEAALGLLLEFAYFGPEYKAAEVAARALLGESERT